MSLIQVKVLGHDTQVQLDAEDDRTYRLAGTDDALTIDMARVGDKLTITLLRPADTAVRSVHEMGTESLEDFDARVAKRRAR